MQFDKAQIIQLLLTQGKQDQASEADRELPQQVDTDQHAGLLRQLGLPPEKVIALLAGSGGLGGVLGGLAGGGQQGGDRQRGDRGSSGGIGGALGGLLGGR